MLSRIRCPVYLFHADDDPNVPSLEVEQFATAPPGGNPQVTFQCVPAGNHYDSMIHEGIPHGIRWLRRHEATVRCCATSSRRRALR